MADDSGRLAERDTTGRFKRDLARSLGKRGGVAKAAKRKMMDSLGLVELEKECTFVPYRNAAEAWRVAVQQEFTERFGPLDGVTSTLIASAALQLGASRWCFAAATGRHMVNVDNENVLFLHGNPLIHAKASKLAADSTASLNAAWEWCERAETRKPARLASGKGVPSLEEELNA